MIEEFGGDPGVRDRGLLESAVTMPAAQFGGEFLHRDISAMAAAYLYHICRNHAFVDGNKRTALATAEIFVLLNDMRLSATNEELEELTRAVAEGKTSKGEVAAFFRRNVLQSEEPTFPPNGAT
ncbi:MAG: type II toxin-antitoxin system death-on-curing family toxin [Candidatus Brocadiae bacterium]|nr:type II toxin-antitoxin system death-on-curing family toxin [Candidatus Brocadiia bacterium]